MSSSAHLPDAAKTASEQPLPLLVGVDESVLTHILARLHDPLPLALTCKTLLNALNSHPCRQAWFDRWHHVFCGDDSVALAVLAWKPLANAGYDLKHLSSFMANTIRHSNKLRDQYDEPLKQSVHLSSSRQWRRLYKLLVPWPEHLLLLATAASPHSKLLTELLRSESESCSSSASSASGVSSTIASALPGSGAADVDPVQQLTHSTASFHIRLATAENGRVQRENAFLRSVPNSFHLPRQQHDILQSALLSAAAAGQHECLQLLLDQSLLLISKSHREPIGRQQTLFMVGLVEAAAAAGNQRCLDTALLGVAAGVCVRTFREAATSQLSRARHQQQEEAQIIANIRQQLHQLAYREIAAGGIQSLSNYCLVSAAGGGSCTVVNIVLHLITTSHIKTQLPAALMAAGRRGHLDVLLLLLDLQELSSKPLEMAATDAATCSWPLTTLGPLLKHIAKHYRVELLQLLLKPLLKALQRNSVLQQPQQTATVAAMLDCIKLEAVTSSPELFGGVLLVLAQQGDAVNVSWVLKVAPTVLVKVGPAAVAAALEGGHPEVAQIIMDAGGERPGAFKAAAKRGELVAAVRNKDLTTVRDLLKECSLPLSWTTDSLAAGCCSETWTATSLLLGYAEAQRNTSTAFQTPCLLNLLEIAAAAGAPESVLLLQLLLPALPREQLSSSRRIGKLNVVTGLIEFCLAKGLVEELQTVFKLCAGTDTLRARIFKNITSLQLPDDNCYMTQNDSDSTCAGAAAVPRPVAAAIALMQQSGGTDLLSLYAAQPLLDNKLPYPVIDLDLDVGGSVRPTFVGQVMPCKKGLKLLLQELTKLDELPASAKVKSIDLYKLMVRAILESANAMLLHAFLKFMEAHGSEMLANVVEKLEQKRRLCNIQCSALMQHMHRNLLSDLATMVTARKGIFEMFLV